MSFLKPKVPQIKMPDPLPPPKPIVEEKVTVLDGEDDARRNARNARGRLKIDRNGRQFQSTPTRGSEPNQEGLDPSINHRPYDLAPGTVVYPSGGRGIRQSSGGPGPSVVLDVVQKPYRPNLATPRAPVRK